MLERYKELMQRYDLESGALTGGKEVVRRLSDLRGTFADEKAYAAELAQGDPELYRVVAVEPANGSGDLHYGLGILYPGKVGNELRHPFPHYLCCKNHRKWL